MFCKAVFLRLGGQGGGSSEHPENAKKNTKKKLLSPAPTKSDSIGVGRPTRSALRNTDLRKFPPALPGSVVSDFPGPHLCVRIYIKPKTRKRGFHGNLEKTTPPAPS